jgi:hypothetical protein
MKLTECPQCGSPVDAPLIGTSKLSELTCLRGHRMPVEMDEKSKRADRDAQRALDDLDRALDDLGRDIKFKF